MSKHKNLTISKKMLSAYRECLRDEERSRATVEEYLRDVRVFLEYVGENQVLGKKRIREYREELRERCKIPSTSSILAAVNSLLVFLGREELEVKLLRVQKVLYSKPKRETTEKDYGKLVRTARRCGDLNVSMLLQTIGSTGIRTSELRFITVESLEARRAEIYNEGEPRVVLLPVELSRMLKKYCREAGILTGSIFVMRHGDSVGRSNVSKKVKQLAREAGVGENRVLPRNFRHLLTKIFYSVRRGVVRLTDLLGHASISMTRVYTMITEDQLRRQILRMRMVLGQLDKPSRCIK